MRKMLFISSLLLATLLSCGGNDEPSNPVQQNVTINVQPELLAVPSAAADHEITVNSTADWSISSDASWCKVFPSGGIKNEATKIKVTVEANKELNARSATLTINSSGSQKKVTITQTPDAKVEVSATKLTAGALAATLPLTVTSNCPWTIKSDADWCKASPERGDAGQTAVNVQLQANETNAARNATLTIDSEQGRIAIAVSQVSDVIEAPAGYTLVWNDEFNDPALDMPDTSQWWYETGNNGWGNNEIQRYVAGKQGDNVVAEVSDGILKIHCIKVGNEILSARINTSESWTYGYFEARLKLPKGKGTWPAFWMMPKNFKTWPGDGEIDIMEEVGYHPNYTSSSIHCNAYNHSIGTQKTNEVYTEGAQDEFHVYALEWTEDYIRTYVDGKQIFNFNNDKKGNYDTWPFFNPFYLKLNLAWGGNWGGAQGVDESALPATYEIDYVRVFQK